MTEQVPDDAPNPTEIAATPKDGRGVPPSGPFNHEAGPTPPFFRPLPHPPRAAYAPKKM